MRVARGIAFLATLVICPGIHEPRLSDRFVTALDRQLQALEPAPHQSRAQAYGLLPANRYSPFCGLAVGAYLLRYCQLQEPLISIGFSAGAMGAIAAAQLWQHQGGTIAAAIALDGWGVPQLGQFPFHRVSHDRFTHWSSALLGSGRDSFYADPPLAHLDLWQFPDRASGWWLRSPEAGPSPPVRTTAIEFIAQMLLRYGCGHKLEPLP